MMDHLQKLACEFQLALQEKLLAQAAEKHQAIGDLQEQVARLQDQVARAEVAPSPTPVRSRLHTYAYARLCLAAEGTCVYMYKAVAIS